MAFGIVKKSELPVAAAGRAAATSPKVGVGGNGQIVMNGFINKALVGVDRACFLHDPESGKVAIIGLKPGEKCKIKGFDEKDSFKPTIGKPDEKTGKGGGDYKFSGAVGFLHQAGYDFKTAGNQTFDAVEDPKMGLAFVFTLPKETPKARPVTPRKPKAEKGNTGIVAPLVPVTEQELLKIGAVVEDNELILE